MKKIFLLTAGFLLLFIINIRADFEVSLRYYTESYIQKYNPREEKFFLKGGLSNYVDFVKYTFSDNSKLFYWSGIIIDTTMGFQDEDVIFDPRDAHFSLIPGFRYERKNYIYQFSLLHDCFHKIDRESNSSPLWNVLKFDLMSKTFYPVYKNQKYSESLKNGYDFGYEYYFSFWYFPYWDIYEWLQNLHNYDYAFEAKANIFLFNYNSLRVSINPELLYYHDKEEGKFKEQNKLFLEFTKFQKKGNLAFYIGYVWDYQNINPSGRKILWGVKGSN